MEEGGSTAPARRWIVEAAGDPWSSAAAGPCAPWALGGLRLGMTIAEARRIRPGLTREPGRDGQGAGAVHYGRAVPGEDGLREAVLADAAGDEAGVTSFSIDLTDRVAGVEDARSRLAERWGESIEPEGIERILIVGKWRDSSCDVEADLRSIARRDDPKKPARIVVTITSLAAREALTRREEAEREQRAREQPW